MCHACHHRRLLPVWPRPPRQTRAAQRWGWRGGELCEGGRPIGVRRVELFEVGGEVLRCKAGVGGEGLDPGPGPSFGVGAGGLGGCVGEAA